mgnify:CR=1 FL=1
MKKIFSLLSVLFIRTSCVTKVALSPDFWNQPSKVGVFVQVNEPAKFKEGSQGLLDMALTSGDKYAEALSLIGQEIQPKNDLVKIYTDILQSHGKEVVVIDESFDPKTATKFKGEKKEGKKYALYDLSYLKSKYNIDEVLFSEVNYGFLISYYGMIETGKSAYTNITTNLVNLSDNSLSFANTNPQMAPVSKWKENHYENSVSAVRETVKKAEEVEANALK